MGKRALSAGGPPRPAGRKGVGEAAARFSGVCADVGAARSFDLVTRRSGIPLPPSTPGPETPGPVQLGAHVSSPGRARRRWAGEVEAPLPPPLPEVSSEARAPQPRLSPHEKSEVAGSRDWRGRPDARAAGKPGGGSGTAPLGVWEAEAMARR